MLCQSEIWLSLRMIFPSTGSRDRSQVGGMSMICTGFEEMFSARRLDQPTAQSVTKALFLFHAVIQTTHSGICNKTSTNASHVSTPHAVRSRFSSARNVRPAGVASAPLMLSIGFPARSRVRRDGKVSVNRRTCRRISSF